MSIIVEFGRPMKMFLMWGRWKWMIQSYSPGGKSIAELSDYIMRRNFFKDPYIKLYKSWQILPILKM